MRLRGRGLFAEWFSVKGTSKVRRKKEQGLFPFRGPIGLLAAQRECRVELCL